MTTIRKVKPRAKPAAARQLLSTAAPAENHQIAQPAPQPPQDADPAFGLPPQLAKILTSVVAPTTLLAALLYYFGWSHAYWFCNYFGVNSTVLGFTSTDYLMRSVDALFVPMTVTASGALLAAWGHALLRARLTAGPTPRALRWAVPAMATLGAILALGGVVSVFTTTVLSHHLVAAPLSLGFGVLLLVYTVHLRRLIARKGKSGSDNRAWGAIAEWAAVFVLIGLSLFWAATDYSAAVGRSRAMDFVATMPSYPNVTVYSEHSLSLQAPGVRELICKDLQAAYRFRYDGLKLVLESGGQYFFLPADWTKADGVAILLPQGSSIRLEFSSPGAEPSSLSTTC